MRTMSDMYKDLFIVRCAFKFCIADANSLTTACENRERFNIGSMQDVHARISSES